MTEAEYWTEYEIIHANKGKTKREIERLIDEFEKSKKAKVAK